MDYTGDTSFRPLLTVVETPEFAARAERLLGGLTRELIQSYGRRSHAQGS
jgi:hypothetical protein